MLRRTAAATAAFALLLVLAVPVMAGGWAEVRADATTATEPPREDRPIVLGFTVLQHGETPIGWVVPTVHVTEFTSGATFDLPATGNGPVGHFEASYTPTDAGFITWHVSFPELIVESPPVTVAIHAADGTAPVFDPGMAVTAISGVRATVRDEVYASLQPEIDRLASQSSLQRAEIDRLVADVDSITAERDQLAARLADAEAGSPASAGMLAGIVLLAVLAGGTTGFAMAWLAGRNAPRQTEVALSPTPRGSTPG